MAKPVHSPASAVFPSLDDYAFLHQIGSGTYARVFKAKDKKSGEVVAIKCVSTKKLGKNVENIVSEIECLKKVEDPHVVQMIGFQWDQRFVYIVMEYCNGGDLSHFIKSRKALQENVARRFLRQLASAVFALHKHSIAHMDLKPQNILLASHPSSSTPILKLADFGFAVHLQGSQDLGGLRGSPLYMAPEIVVDQHYDERADLWSIGVILYETLFGRAPFASQSYDELIDKIVSSDEIHLPSEPALTAQCRHLLTGLLQRDPGKRMSFAEFFADPFIDLEHLPGEASLKKGSQYADLAVQLDNQHEYQAAVHMYCVALEYLMPLVDYQDSSESRRKLRHKVADYLRRTEQLRSNLVTEDNSKTLEMSAEVDRLQDEATAKRDSHLLIAMMQAHNAQAMDARGDYEEALSLYEDSLATLLSIIQKMERGSQRSKLAADVKVMLKRAEEIKSQIPEPKLSAEEEAQQSMAAAATAVAEGSKKKTDSGGGYCAIQ